MKKAASYIVVCKGVTEGVYVLATHRQFRSYSEAELYTLNISAARAPIIVTVD